MPFDYNAGVYRSTGQMGYNPNTYPMQQQMPYNPTPQMAQMPQMTQNQYNQYNQPNQMQQAVQPQQTAQMPVRTNKILVTSLDEALSRSTDYNSATVYFHQSEPYAFQIFTDMQGRKTPYVYKITECSVEEMQMKLTKRDMQDWKQNLENADGTHGEHFDMSQIRQAAQAMNIQMRNFDEKDLCMTANMLYSDYCEAIKKSFPNIPREKELMLYVDMAKAFLEDEDAEVKGSEKLAAYYFAIVDEE